MKFGETFTEYLQMNQEMFMEKCSHVEYKRLKKVLKSCRRCRAMKDSAADSNGEEDTLTSQYCQYESCPLCDQKFFSELMKEASDIAGCFSSRVRRLVQVHVHGGMQRYITFLRACFATNQQQSKAQECRMLIEYVMMNAIAMRKILKKYDKVHSSVNGRKFKSKMRAERMEILQSPWLIELGAFYINFNDSSNGEKSDGLPNPFTFDLNASAPMVTLKLPDSSKLEYNLTCAICLELVFNPYALGCGHLFCKLCVCSAASVLIFQGPKDANPESKCPVCREANVYSNAVHMMELDLLLKKDCKEYWKERMIAERAEMVKQSKIYWETQTKCTVSAVITMAQLKPVFSLLFTLCVIVPLTSAKSIDVHYCDKNAEYAVKVNGVDILPYPVSRGKETNFKISASTDEIISGGKINIDVSYFGFHVHNEKHDICKETRCPVSIGDFVLSHSKELPGFTPPGSYTFRMSMEDEKKKQLTCINFDFTIGFLKPESLAYI